MAELDSFGKWLKRRRREFDLTQAQLAQRVGCSAAAIRKIEADERKPSQQLAELLAKELHVAGAEKEVFVQFARHIVPQERSLSAIAAGANISDALHPTTPSNNLPAFLTSLIDRARDIAAVRELITSDAVRWVTLIGPPGIGKTRLSIHCGEQALPHFRDGVWFVDLAALREADFVLSTIGRTLSHFDLSQSSSLEQLTTGLREKELLLVLDNFEQVESAAREVAALLKSCPKVKTLISSRVPLNISGEYKYFVPPLSVPSESAASSPESLMQFEAVQLFVARTRQFQTGFQVSAENARAIVEICTRMDGIPLALELAAASLRHMSLTELAGILRGENETNWLRQIGHPARDLPPRQQTLENVIAWSYTLLAPDRQAFFRRLGIFTGQFQDEAAAHICGDSGMDANRARAELEYLTDHSLLQQSQVDGHPYWHMLETIHEFALQQMTPEELRETESAHAKYYRRFLGKLSTDSAKINLELFFQIHGDNLHQALRWVISTGQIDLALSLATDLGMVWEHVGCLREGMDLIQQVLSMRGTADRDLRIKFLERAATLAWQQHRFDLASSLAEEAIETAKSDHLNNIYPMLLNLKGRILIEWGKYHEAYEALHECYDLSLADPATFNAGVPLVQLGEIELAFGNYVQAQSKLMTALGYLKGKDDIFLVDIFLAVGLTDLAEVALANQDYGEARSRLQSAKDVAGRHVRRLLCYLSTLAGYLTLGQENDRRSLQRAGEIYGAIESLEEYSGAALVPFYSELNTSRIALTRHRLGRGKWESAWQTGRKWKKEEILARALDGIFS
ncbi:MAG TPA: helix-turn-helix domain-containing protein [Anaerolineales bacterium]|nr:helix-turn-helix domain-containing protein [Anaerolineales bacterium]